MSSMYFSNAVVVGVVSWLGSLRYTPAGTPVFEFGVYCKKRISNAPSGDKRYLEQTYKVVTWRSLAENCSKFLEKKQGVTVFTKSPITAEAWEKEGEIKTAVVFPAEDVQFGARWTDNPIVTGEAPPEDDFATDSLPF